MGNESVKISREEKDEFKRTYGSASFFALPHPPPFGLEGGLTKRNIININNRRSNRTTVPEDKVPFVH